MTVPLVVLAILSTVGGLVGIPYALSGGAVNNYFEQTLEPVVAHSPENGDLNANAGHESSAGAQAAPAPAEHSGALPHSVGEGEAGRVAPAEHAHDPAEVSSERLFTVISVAIGLIGIGIGWFWFKRKPLYEMPRLLEEKYYVDEIYDAAIIRPIKTGSREGLWKFFDVGVVDGIVNGMGRGMTSLGGLLRYMQPGFVRSYAAIILLGALAVVGYFAFNAYQLLSK